MGEERKASDFRYNTGATRVPWAAVGENYNAEDALAIVRFLMQGGGDAYDAAYEALRRDLLALSELSTPPGKLSMGDEVARAEDMADRYLGTKGAVLVSTATAGFEIAYKYANLQPGDEVIVPAITFIATIAYPLAVGAKLVFADLDPRTLNMDPEDVRRKCTDRTKMIVPVHLGGYPVDMDPIIACAHEHGALVLEDAAHAFGAKYKGRSVGAIADFTAFSLHEVKNLTSFGEGGLLTTTIPGFAPEMKRARFFGLDFARKIPHWLYDVTAIPGHERPFAAGNASVTEIQALGLQLQLQRYDRILAERRAAAEYLNRRFAAEPAILPQCLGENGTEPSFHLYLLQIDPAKAGGDVQALRQKLEAKGVTNIPHFGPLYHFDVLREMGYDAEALAKTCPVCEEVFARRFTHLPLYGLSEEQLTYMADAVLESVDELRRGV